MLWHSLRDTPNPFLTRKPIAPDLNFEITYYLKLCRLELYSSTVNYLDLRGDGLLNLGHPIIEPDLN